MDDDRSVRISLDRLLRTADLESVGFASAEEFLASLERVDGAAVTGCVVLDLQLPRMNGIDLMQLLTQSYPGLRVVLVTGSHDSRAEATANKFGVPILKKPFDDDELLAALAASKESMDAANQTDDSADGASMSLD